MQEFFPNMKHKFVVLDQDGELYRNPAVVNLFCKYNYEVFPNGDDSSFQNGPVERARCTIMANTKSLLFGSSLDIKFWPYLFHHTIQIRNYLPY